MPRVAGGREEGCQMKCPVCGEREQVQVRRADAANPDRDRIRCRCCGTEATRYWWARLEERLASFEALVNERVHGDKVK